MAKKKAASPKKEMIGVTIVVDESHQDKLTTVAKNLKAKGFVLSESLEAIGTLTGHAPPDSVADLSNVPGVAGVEKERSDYHTQD